MNGLAWLAARASRRKLAEPLKTMPVGAAGPAWPGGIATTSDCGTPLPSYSVDVDVPVALTRTKPCGSNAIPQPSTRLASTFGAPVTFATSTRATYPLQAVGSPAP
jgi:hypothetical protein